MMRVAGFTIAMIVIISMITSSGVYGEEFSDTQKIRMVTSSSDVYGEEFFDTEEIKLENLLKRINKPAVKSIQSEDGDIIDCVPIASQPALDHPLLKNHTIQMKPSFTWEDESKYNKEKEKAIIQVWQKNGDCPENTVPIRRVKKEDIIRAKSLKNFRQQNRRPAKYVHEYAVKSLATGKKFYGTEFELSLWNPKVQVSTEFSLAQTWLSSGSLSDVNTIEAGWQVYQYIYGDTNTRLFVFWTKDGYKSMPLCYNLACKPGFVQVSNRIVVAGSLLPVSQYNGKQEERSMKIRKDPNKKAWWLKIGKELVGYWPDNLFTTLQNGATSVSWGGEVINFKINGKHTTTDMGSGHFAEEGNKKASYFRNLMIYDDTYTLKEPQVSSLKSFVTNAKCYNLKTGASGTPWGVNFFFGGPGQNPNCP